MTAKRTGIHLVSVFLLLLWGGIMLYFYASGRISHYLPPDGIFRAMVLWSSIGMVVLGLFNLVTMRAREAACCADDGHEHDHDHDHHHDHDHGHAHEHKHDHKAGCCGHDHDHDHGHKHEPAAKTAEAAAKSGGGCCGGHGHEHKHDHGPSHSHEGHQHGPGCGHDHHDDEHDHEHAHAHGCCGHDHEQDEEHDHAHGGHTHGILEESGAAGRIVAILLLAVPVSYAAINTPDKFSSNAVENKGVYTQNYGQGARAEQFSLKRERGGDNRNAVTSAPAPAPAPVASAPPVAPAPAAATPSDSPPAATPPAPAPGPGTAGSPPPPPGSAPMPKVNVAEVEKQAVKGAESKSYGSFTLADLEAQVPKSPEGNFILEVTELYYTAGDKEVQAVLTGQPVETIGQILPEKVNNEKGTRVRLFRMLVQCCAADARPYSIPVEFGKAPPQFKDMSWVKVVGKMSFKTENNQTVPVLEATSITETAAPENQMIY